MLSASTPVVLAYTESGSVYAMTFGVVLRFNGYGVNVALLETAPAQVKVGQEIRLIALRENGSTQTRKSHKVVGIVPVQVNDKGEVITELTGQESAMVDAVMAMNAVGPVRPQPSVPTFARAEHLPMAARVIK